MTVFHLDSDRRNIVAASARHSGAREGEEESDASSESLGPEAANWRLFRASLVHQERAGLFSDRVPAALQPRLRVVLPRRWAHELGAPERGCLLVARRPDMGPLLTQSVILLLEHDDHGSAGLILNCPSAGARVRSCTCLPDIAGAFKQQLLYQGGSVATERLHLLHGNPAVANTFEVMDGIYTGGLAHANELVASGRAAASEFKLLAGYAHWPTGQLQREISGGAWWLVAASSDFILSSVRGQQQQMHGVREKAALWRGTLQLAGLGPGSRQHH
ncbi:g3127 [Coccomyxa elongata]